MSWLELILIGVGLAMDAVAVSLGKGLAAGQVKTTHCLLAGGYFGGFQALMPLIGYALGRSFANYIDRYDHWVAFALLALIGANMIRESFGKEDAPSGSSFGAGAMLPLAVATSIDALAVGVSFSLYLGWMKLIVAILLIGLITFVLSAVAVWVGGVCGGRHQKSAERLGGVILIVIAVKMLLDGLGIFA